MNNRFGEYFRHFRLMLGLSEDKIVSKGFPLDVLRDIESGIANPPNWQRHFLMIILTGYMLEED